MSNSKDQDMLNQYPDLSDDEDNQPEEPKKEQILPHSQPHKIIKPNEPIQSTTNKPVFTAPLLFGGKSFIPPPPPPSSKGKIQTYSPPPPPINHQYPQSGSNSNNPRHQQVPKPERQRKNCIFVKNIPKHYNEVQKLMTFFKNEGQIREIKVNHQESTATVRFSKEEDSIKFSHSKKAIFNRGFITYSLNEKDVVPAEYIKQREFQESGKMKKPVQVQMKESKERLETLLADKIRALLFLVKNVNQESKIEELRLQLQAAIAQKKALQKYGLQQLQQASKAIINEYDWTLTYTLANSLENVKKTVFFQLQKKYGPVSILQFTPINKQEIQSKDPLPQKGPEQAKLIFLGIKSSWGYYYQNSVNKNEQSQQKNNLQVKGTKLRSLFNEGAIKKPMISVVPSSSKQDAKDQLVEVLVSGQVKPIPQQQQRVIEPQVDQGQVRKDPLQQDEGQPKVNSKEE